MTTELQPSDAYGEAFDRALAGARRELRSSPALPRDVARRLARKVIPTRVEMAIRNPSVPLVDALVEYTTELAGSDAAKAVAAAELAVAVADQLDPAEYATDGARLRALTSLIARSKDVADHRRGEQAVDAAWKILGGFGYSPDDEIDCLIATGYLYYTMDSVQEMFFIAEDALALARELNDSERVARSLKLRSCAQSERGQLREAIDSLNKARKLTKDPRLQFACCQNLALNYCALGRYQVARAALAEAAGLASKDLGSDYELRLLWARARIEAHAGESSDVQATLETIAEGFLRLGRPQTFADAAIEIAMLLADRGEWQDAIGLAEQCAGWFRALGLERDSVAANAIAAHVRGRELVRRALLALSVSIKKRAGRQGSSLAR